MGVGGWVGMAVFWVAVVALVLWGVSRLFPTRHAPSAWEVLDARLASGELDPVTYRALRDELDGTRDTPSRPTGV
jgi:uncharacterized membrane protein